MVAGMPGRCYAAQPEHPLDSPHGRCRQTGRHAAPGSWPAVWGPSTTTSWWCWAPACQARPSCSVPARTALPLDTLPFFPPFTVGGHRAQGWSVALEGRAAPRLRRASPPLRGHRARPKPGAPGAHRDRRGLHHCHPHVSRRRHPARPPHRVGHGGRGPPEPDRPQPAAAARPSSTWPTPTRPTCAPLRWRRPHPTARARRRGPASTRSSPGPQFETPAEVAHARDARRRRRRHVAWRSRRSPPATAGSTSWVSPSSPTRPASEEALSRPGRRAVGRRRRRTRRGRHRPTRRRLAAVSNLWRRPASTMSPSTCPMSRAGSRSTPRRSAWCRTTPGPTSASPAPGSTRPTASRST